MKKKKPVIAPADLVRAYREVLELRATIARAELDHARKEIASLEQRHEKETEPA